MQSSDKEAVPSSASSTAAASPSPSIPIPIPIPILPPVPSLHSSPSSTLNTTLTPAATTNTMAALTTPVIPSSSSPSFGIRVPTTPATVTPATAATTSLPVSMYHAAMHNMQSPQPALANSSINAAAAAAVGAAMNYFPHQFLLGGGVPGAVSVPVPVAVAGLQSPLNINTAAALGLQQAMNRAAPYGIMATAANAAHLATSPPHGSPTAVQAIHPAFAATATLASPIATAQRQAILAQHPQPVSSPPLHVSLPISSDDPSASASTSAPSPAPPKPKAKKRPAESADSATGDASASKKKKKASTEGGAAGDSVPTEGAEPPKKKARKSSAVDGAEPTNAAEAEEKKKKKPQKPKVKQESTDGPSSSTPTAASLESSSLNSATATTDDPSAADSASKKKKKTKPSNADLALPLDASVKEEGGNADMIDVKDIDSKQTEGKVSSASKKPRVKPEAGGDTASSSKKKVHAKHIDTYMAHPLWLNRPMNPYALFSKAERVKLKGQIAQRESEREKLIAEGKINPNDTPAPTGTLAPASFTADQTVADMTWTEVQSLHSVGHQNQLISARWKSLPPDIKQPFESEYDAKENEWLKQLQSAVDGGDSMASEVLKEWRKKKKGFDEATGEIIKKPPPVPKLPVGRIINNDLKHRPKRGLVVDAAYRAQQFASSGGYISTIKRPGSTTYFGGEIPQPRVRKWIDLLPDPRASHTSFKTEAVALIHAATEEFIGWLGQQTVDTAEARQSKVPSIQDLRKIDKEEFNLSMTDVHLILLDEKSALCGTRRPSSSHTHEQHHQHHHASSSNDSRGRPMPVGMPRSAAASFPAAQASPSWGVEEDEDSDGSPPPPLHPRVEPPSYQPAAAAATAKAAPSSLSASPALSHPPPSTNAPSDSLVGDHGSDGEDEGADDQEGIDAEDQDQVDEEDEEEPDEGVGVDADADAADNMVDDDDEEEADANSAMEE